MQSSVYPRFFRALGTVIGLLLSVIVIALTFFGSGVLLTVLAGPSPLHRLGAGVASFLITGLVVFLLGLGAHGSRFLWRTLTGRRWTRSMAYVTEGTIVEIERKGSPFFAPILFFTYTVGHEQHTGRRYLTKKNAPCRSPEEAKQILAKHPQGKRIRIRYDPAHPRTVQVYPRSLRHPVR